MKNILIYPNSSKSNIKTIVCDVICEILKYGNHKIYLPSFFEEDMENTIKLPLLECLEHAELVLTLGGDGTMLSAIPHVVPKKIPMLGINFGNLGFLTELDMSEISYLEKIFSGDVTIEERMVLDVKISRNNEIIYENLALNDIIIKTENSFRIMQLEVKSDDTPVLSFGGDGVIIATPTGSTAYSMSAGGPIVEPEALNICVTPICSHKFSGKSFIFSKDRVIKIKPKARNSNLAYIAVDGNNTVRLNEEDVVIVEKSRNYASFIRVKGQKFYQVLTEKIGGTFKNEI